MTLVCVPIMVEDIDGALRDAALARAAGADMVEFRVDHVFHGEGSGSGFDGFGASGVRRLCRESALACIVTCRSSSEGGGYDGDDASRALLYEQLGTLESPDHPPRYIDVEWATYSRSANLRQKVDLAVDFPACSRDLAPGLILSSHDFGGRPANLSRTIASMDAERAAKLNKIAFQARSLRDNLEVFDLLRHAQRPTIALAMGEFGLMSRVLAPKFGGFLTFAALRDQAATAPGQPTIADLLGLYRFRSITARTKVYGVIGWPVAHSLSPRVHNAGFASVGHDGVYLPLPVPPEWEHFKATLSALLDDGHLDFRGASVTLPHKGHLVRFAREDRARRWRIDSVSERCGASNTLAVRDDGSCEVINTDAPAAVASLECVAGVVRGRRVAVIGAGGVARAVACGLLDAGATVVVYNRDAGRAERLVSDLSGSGKGKIVVGVWDRLCDSRCEAFVNCTPVGMRGGPDPDGSVMFAGPSGGEGATVPYDSSGVVMDTVYSPLETALLRRARGLGLKTVGGADMFVRQGVLQMGIWTAESANPGTESAGSTHDLYAGIVRSALAAPVDD